MSFMKFIFFALLGCLLAVPVTWATTTPKKEPELACADNKDIEKIMNEKGYSLLLNMTRREDNKEGIVETLWVGGSNAVITATTKNGTASCFIASMNNVIINPQTIEDIFEIYKKQNKQKDI